MLMKLTLGWYLFAETVDDVLAVVEQKLLEVFLGLDLVNFPHQ